MNKLFLIMFLTVATSTMHAAKIMVQNKLSQPITINYTDQSTASDTIGAAKTKEIFGTTDDPSAIQIVGPGLTPVKIDLSVAQLKNKLNDRVNYIIVLPKGKPGYLYTDIQLSYARNPF